MPVEIKELHIRVNVSGKAPESPKSRQSAAKDEDHGGPGGDKDQIVAECVEQVLHILQAKKER
jgi:hypothetical protein